MELLILKFVAMVRPLASMEYAQTVFAILGLGLFGALVAALLARGALRQSLRLSLVDGMVMTFTVWCIATSVIYYEGVRISDVAKLLIPLLSYTVVKNVVPDQREYGRLLFWILLGFAVPTLTSAALILVGSSTAVGYEMYWTNIIRWKGVYTGAHNFGLSMTLLLATIVLYANLRVVSGQKALMFRRTENSFLALLGVAALYCLYMSQVRTGLLGLLIFLGVYVYLHNKRLFLYSAAGLAAVALMTAPYWLRTLYYESEMMKKQGSEASAMELGSGRPRIWLNDIQLYIALPVDQQLAGTGIGNRKELVIAGELVGHNDWIELLTQTGLIGVALFAFLQIAIVRKILKLQGEERNLFLALFVSVIVMMAVSNSYIWRIQVSQLYYFLLAYIELPGNREHSERVDAQRVISTA